VKILAVTEPDWYGVRRALAAVTPRYATPSAAVRVIEEQPPDVVIFGCYRPEWKPVLDAAIQQNCRRVLTWYASYILNEFDRVNRDWMVHALRLARAGDFTHVATPHSGLAASWTHFGIATDVLPPVVNIDALKGITPSRSHGVHIGIFGSGQPWKNMDTQVIGAAMVPNGHLHVQHVHDRRLLDFFKIPLSRYGYLADRDYYQLLANMHVNLCVTASESFSYLVAESLLLGTPVLASSITPIMRAFPTALAISQTAFFEDPSAICDGVLAIMKDHDAEARIGRECMLAFNDDNRRAAQMVIDGWA
jgi:hypothetical protein